MRDWEMIFMIGSYCYSSLLLLLHLNYFNQSNSRVNDSIVVSCTISFSVWCIVICDSDFDFCILSICIISSLLLLLHLNMFQSIKLAREWFNSRIVHIFFFVYLGYSYCSFWFWIFQIAIRLIGSTVSFVLSIELAKYTRLYS